MATKAEKLKWEIEVGEANEAAGAALYWTSLLMMEMFPGCLPELNTHICGRLTATDANAGKSVKSIPELTTRFKNQLRFVLEFIEKKEKEREANNAATK